MCPRCGSDLCNRRAVEAEVAAVKNSIVQYFVEGEDDKKIIDTLKTQMGLIKPGKVQVLNVVTEEITDLRLRALSPGTTVVLVFDVDAGNVDILGRNIKKLKECSAVSDVLTIPQVPNLEGELLRSCDIRKIEDLLNSKSRRDFKSDLLRVTNLTAKLQEHKFNIDLFWAATPSQPFHTIENQASKIKLKKK